MSTAAPPLTRKPGDRDMLPFRLEPGFMRNHPHQFLVYEATVCVAGTQRKVPMQLPAGNPSDPDLGITNPLAAAVVKMLTMYWTMERQYDAVCAEVDALASENGILKGEISDLKRKVLSLEMQASAAKERRVPKNGKE
jgi:hypothetical protein